jgi:hypothetical protein
MPCSARIPVVLTLLIAAAEGVIPTAVIAGVVSSLQRHYLSGCVFLLHTAEKSDLSRYLPRTLTIGQGEMLSSMSTCLMLKVWSLHVYQLTYDITVGRNYSHI